MRASVQFPSTQEKIKSGMALVAITQELEMGVSGSWGSLAAQPSENGKLQVQ